MKSKSTVISKPDVQDAPTVRILKRASCPSVSRKSSLVYEVGFDEHSKELQLRVVSNSGRGCFSQAWFRLDAIRAHLDKAEKGATVTSYVLAPLFRGVSQNTAGFVWAVLVDTGFVVPSATKKRAYERTEPTAFTDDMTALIEGRTPAKTYGKSKKSGDTKSVTRKTPSGTTKKAK